MNEYLTVEELAKLLRVHKNTAYRYVRSGVVPSIRIGGRWRVKESDLPQSRTASEQPENRNGVD